MAVTKHYKPELKAHVVKKILREEDHGLLCAVCPHPYDRVYKFVKRILTKLIW